MALIKPVAGTDGVTTSYHRVVGIESIVSSDTFIEVASYVSRESRGAQLAQEEAQRNGYDAPVQQYVHTTYYHLGYVDGMTARAAYAYLLTLPEFSGAASDEGDA